MTRNESKSVGLSGYKLNKPRCPANVVFRLVPCHLPSKARAKLWKGEPQNRWARARIGSEVILEQLNYCEWNRAHVSKMVKQSIRHNWYLIWRIPSLHPMQKRSFGCTQCLESPHELVDTRLRVRNHGSQTSSRHWKVAAQQEAQGPRI